MFKLCKKSSCLFTIHNIFKTGFNSDKHFGFRKIDFQYLNRYPQTLSDLNKECSSKKKVNATTVNMTTEM